MPRALAIRYLLVSDGVRADYRARLGERTATARTRGYNLWAFEQDGDPSRVVEFLETSSTDALDVALETDDVHADPLGRRVDPGTPTTRWERFLGIPQAS